MTNRGVGYPNEFPLRRCKAAEIIALHQNKNQAKNDCKDGYPDYPVTMRTNPSSRYEQSMRVWCSMCGKTGVSDAVLLRRIVRIQYLKINPNQTPAKVCGKRHGVRQLRIVWIGLDGRGQSRDTPRRHASTNWPTHVPRRGTRSVTRRPNHCRSTRLVVRH